MFDLHWFHDISMDTSVRNVGWSYVVLGISIIVTVVAAIKLIKEWKQ